MQDADSSLPSGRALNEQVVPQIAGSAQSTSAPSSNRAMGLEEAQEAGCFDAEAVRHSAFGKVGAELLLERVSDDKALVRLHIGHLSFGIGQPRNGIEAASVMRTFREALTDLLAASYAQGRKDEREELQAVIAQDKEFDAILEATGEQA